jgi:hypothetical protein
LDSHLLLDHLMRQEGLERIRLELVTRPARDEADVALAVADGKADAGCAVETAPRQLRLGFVPLFRERYDVAPVPARLLRAAAAEAAGIRAHAGISAAQRTRRLRDCRPGPGAPQRAFPARPAADRSVGRPERHGLNVQGRGKPRRLGDPCRRWLSRRSPSS